MKLRRRISSGSMSSSMAAWSTRRSTSAAASGRPAPRYAPVGVVVVTGTTTSKRIRGNVYVALDMRLVPAGNIAPMVG